MSLDSAESFLTHFFAARRLTESDDRPLYRYHLRGNEFETLGKVLSRDLSDGLGFQPQLDLGRPDLNRRIGPKAAMAFCLWASDWLHRNYKGGPRTWRLLLADLDRTEFGPGNSRYQDLQSLVIRGVRGWGRTIQRAGPQWRYLDTLLWEGGIPNHLVQEGTLLRDYLGALLEEFRLFVGTGTPCRDLAERLRNRLPLAWRREVIYELAGDLIAGVWSLQGELGDTTTPVEDLDRTRPNWRDELPIRMSDNAARALLNGLVIEANEVKKRTRLNMRWNLRLVRAFDEQWEMRGSLRLPTSVNEEALQRLFPRTDIPGRFHLKMQTPQRSLGLVALGREDAATPRGRLFRIDPIGDNARLQGGLVRPRMLVMQDMRGRDLGSTDLFSGSSGLDDLPWVFAPVNGPEGATTYRYDGSGSVRIREPSAMVALTPGTSITSLNGSVLTAGTIRNADRTAYLVKGRAVATDEDGTEAVIETRSTADTRNIEYQLFGRKPGFGDGVDPIFLGGVRVHQRHDGEPLGRVSERNLQWKPDVPGGRFGSYSRDAGEKGEILGRGRLRLLENGETRYSTSLVILPPDADVRIRPSAEPNRGAIELVGFGNVVAVVDEADNIQVDGYRIEHGYRLSLDARSDVPREVNVVVDWGGRARARLKLPFPARRAEFVRADGRPLPEGANLAQVSVGGITADVFVPEEGRYQLRGFPVAESGGVRRNGVFVREIPSQAFGHYVLDLANVSREITERLESTSDPYARIKLQIVDAESGAPFPSALVFVTRFDLSFTCHDAALGLVKLSEDSLAQVTAEEMEALEVAMLTLLKPETEPIPVRPRGPATWQVPGDVEPGPYLICGRHGDMQRVRPLRWYVGDPTERRNAVATSVAAAYALAFVDHQRFREAPFSPVVEAMAGDPGHEGWEFVTAYLRWDQLPVTTFPLLRAMIENPVACAMAAAIASGPEDLRLLSRMERFPFAWWQVPLCAWQEAYSAFGKQWRERLSATGDSDTAWDILDRLVGRSIDRVRSRLPGLTGALGFLKADVCEVPLPDVASRCCRPEIIRSLTRQYREHRNQCPVRMMAPGEIPHLPGLRRKTLGLIEDHAWCSSLFVQPETGGPLAGERANIENVAAFAAVSVILCRRPSSALAGAIRQLRHDHSDWFDEALRLASLVAFGSRERAKILRQQRV